MVRSANRSASTGIYSPESWRSEIVRHEICKVMLLALLAALLPDGLLVHIGANAPRHAALPCTSLRCSMCRMATTDLELSDRADDALRFTVAQDGVLQLFVENDLFCPAIRSVEYEEASGTVITRGDTEEERGEFRFVEVRKVAEAEKLRTIVNSVSGVEWRDTEPLPVAIEALLIDESLRESRPGVRLLWALLLDVYPSQEAALAAVAKNSAIVLPYLNMPRNIQGSWSVLNDLMSPEEALDVVTKNPGILACNPDGLRDSNAGSIKAAAGVVDVVDAVPVGGRYAISIAVLGAGAALIVSNSDFSALGF